MEIVTITVDLVDKFYFYMANPIKAWLGSWSPICITLILLSALTKLAGTSATILYNSMERRHPWRTNIRVKGSDRRLFILILNSILGYATLIMQKKLSPYPNLGKAEKIKSTVRIPQKDFYSVYLTHKLSQIAERVCTVKLFCF